MLDVGSGVIKTLKFVANLDLAVGDMDLGALDGAQYPASMSVGSALTVEMRINTGVNNVNAVDLKLEYNPMFLYSC